MCDFKPGDEVVCIGSDHIQRNGQHVVPGQRGKVFTIADVGVCPTWNTAWVTVENCPEGVTHPLGWIDARCFRKVQRRDLTAWLATENTIEEPKRAPAKEPV